jgi:hypothetical protein
MAGRVAEQGTPPAVAPSASLLALPVIDMPKDRTSSLQRDLSVFLDPGFLFAAALVALLSAVGAGILVFSAEEYGIPLSGYWR